VCGLQGSIFLSVYPFIKVIFFSGERNANYTRHSFVTKLFAQKKPRDETLTRNKNKGGGDTTSGHGLMKLFAAATF
jgi:hypothetical protein